MENLRANFDLRNGLNIIRLISGLFYFPHIIYKVTGIDGSLAFFAKAGLNPPLAFLVLALITETICAFGLTLGIMVRWVGLMSAGALVTATYATIATKGLGWLWNKGGIEYTIFWAILSLALALIAWREHWAAQPKAVPQTA